MVMNRILAAAIDSAPHLGPRLLMSPGASPSPRDSCVNWRGPVASSFADALRPDASSKTASSSKFPSAISCCQVANPARALLDAVVRLLPGVMGKMESGEEESFEDGLLEHPHYTKPRTWEGLEIPQILLSGDHKAIAKWKHGQREALTKQRRPDLWQKYLPDKN